MLNQDNVSRTILAVVVLLVGFVLWFLNGEKTEKGTYIPAIGMALRVS